MKSLRASRRFRSTIPISDDVYDEFDEVFTLALADTANADLPQDLFEGTIRNDDPATEISLIEAAFDEGTPGQKAVQVRLDRPSGKPIAFNYAFTSDTATQNDDWQGIEDQTISENQVTGQMRIAPGIETLDIPIGILDDNIFEGDEQFAIKLSNLINAVSPVPEAHYTSWKMKPHRAYSLRRFHHRGRAHCPAPTLDTPAAMPLTLQVLVRDDTAVVGRDLEPLVDLIRLALARPRPKFTCAH